jgi:hypothetical protein
MFESMVYVVEEASLGIESTFTNTTKNAYQNSRANTF